jgi:hypothetical protein
MKNEADSFKFATMKATNNIGTRWHMYDFAACSSIGLYTSGAAFEARLARCYSQLQYTPYLLPLEWVADTQQQSRLLHIVVLVA